MTNHWGLVSSLTTAVHSGDDSLGALPKLLRRVLQTGAWVNFTPPGGKPVIHERFVTFVVEPPTRGLGATPELLRRLCRDHRDVLVLLDEALQGRQGARSDLVDNINEVERPSGTSESAALRRLRKQRPDLLERYKNGELTAHAAMIKAGFRPRTISIRTDNPERIAATLSRQLSQDILQAVVDKLVNL